MTPETRVKSRLKKYLIEIFLAGDNGYYTTVSDRYKSGMPDFLGILRGKATFFEAKASKGVFSRIQQVVARELMRAGANYYIVTLDEQDKLKFYDLNNQTDWEKWAPSKV